MSVYCTLFSQTFYGILFCYLTITDVHETLYLQIIDFQFPSCCTSQPPKKLNQIITVNSSTNTPRSYHRKNNSCTLCVPMFIKTLSTDFSWNGYLRDTNVFRLVTYFFPVLLNGKESCRLKNMVGDYRHNSIFDFRTCYYILHCNEFFVCLNFMLVLSIF